MGGIEFDRAIYFDAVRGSLFGGSMDQGQVNGQEAILTVWERRMGDTDLRHLAYMLATTLHETAATMLPIEEYGKGAGQPYGVPDGQTGQTYYGRGFVQLTWRDNYAMATRELHLRGEYDLEWNATRALGPLVAAAVMFKGMEQGWFRTSSDGDPQTLERYFSPTKDDSFTAREIINGDKNIVPSWSNGVSIGDLISNYHKVFLGALNSAVTIPEPVPPPHEPAVVVIETEGDVLIKLNGKVVTS